MNCGDFIGIHYISNIKYKSRNTGIGLKKSRDFGIEKLTGIPGFQDPGIKTLSRMRLKTDNVANDCPKKEIFVQMVYPLHCKTFTDIKADYISLGVMHVVFCSRLALNTTHYTTIKLLVNI